MYIWELETLVLIPFWAVALEEVGGDKAPKNRKRICASILMSSVFPLWKLPQALPSLLKRCLRLLRGGLRGGLRGDLSKPGSNLSDHIVGYDLEYCKKCEREKKENVGQVIAVK